MQQTNALSLQQIFRDETHARNVKRFNYTPGNTIQQETENHPYLGVWITKELTWNKHIHQITASTSCTLAFIRWNLNIHHRWYGTNTPGPHR